MENPFFGGFWDRIPERRSYSRPHYYYPNPYAATSYATPVKSDYDYESATKIKPNRVVSIPVNFASSDAVKSASSAVRKQMDETTAAVKIQAAFRGFCVRKPQPLKKLRVIMKTNAEAAEIRRRLNDSHLVGLIRRDERERLKITECIMSLLLRLDAIQGVNSFVRESRKAVTRELVNLQETIDDIISGKSMQDMTTETPVNSEAEGECPNVEENAPVDCLQENFNGEIKYEGLPGLANEADVNDNEAEQIEMQEVESLPSQMQDLQIEKSPEDEEDNNDGLENFEQNFSEANQTVPGPEECISVDGADEEAEASKEKKFEGAYPKENKFGSPVLESDTLHSTDKDVMIGNSRNDGRSSEALDLLKMEAIQSDRKLEANDNMDCEEAGDQVPKKEEGGMENIDVVREENERLKRTVSDLLKKNEMQTEMIDNLSLRISQLEEQVSQCSKKKKMAGGKKQSSTSTEERTAHTNDRRRKMNRHLKNCFKEDWF
ncbi:hypothetical protein KI387_030831 [Taxus chinensis]|uniref:BAG domain-containing protein n=1 Tax=Taxus chinensis TaxID=29808 RepID=A0AA38CLT7_TAXCH|nr:hypothetical protein KI387_030831 [Taxus chinensis]